MSDPADDELVTAPIVQRTVSAADAPPVNVAARSSVWDIPWIRNAPSTEAADEAPTQDSAPPPETSAPTEGAIQQPPEGETMATRNGAARSRKSSRGSPQLQICSVLLQNDMTRVEIAAALPELKAAQIYSALHTAAANKRVKPKGDAYTLTAVGREWVQAAQTGETAAEPKRSVVHRRAKATRKPAEEGAPVDTSPRQGSARTFRCAVINDGGFWITKNGVEIELDADEHADMLAYLERTAEPATT